MKPKDKDLWIVEFYSSYTGYYGTWIHLFDREHRKPQPLEKALVTLRDEQARLTPITSGAIRIRNIHSDEVVMGAVVV